MSRLGLIALWFYLTHSTFHIMHGNPHHLLWACHLASALIGIGLLTSSALTNGIGTLFLCIGTPLWVLDLASGAAFYPTSLLTHIGGLLIGLYGVKRMGLPPGTWFKAIGALAAIIAISRVSTPAEANVNMAFAVQRDLDPVFASHLTYLASIMLFASTCFYLLERATRRWLPHVPERKMEP